MAKVILVAEDEPLTQKLVTTVLEHCGFSTKVASNGRECIDLIAAGLKPDLLFLDLAMPEMDGFAVLEKLANEGYLESFPIIVFTAERSKEQVLKAIEMGAYDYIVKPFNVMDLSKRVKDLIFEVDEGSLREVLGNLRIQDPQLLHTPGLQRIDRARFAAYPSRIKNKTVALLLPEGVLPQGLAKGAWEDIIANLRVYHRCQYGWRKVWPTYSTLERKAS